MLNIKTIIFGIAIFICAFAYFAPASIIQQYLPNHIYTSGISGTLWNGSVQNLVIDKVGIQNTNWTANPFSLLTGRINTNVKVNSHNLKGSFNSSYSGTELHAKDINLNGELSLWAPYFETFGLTINGFFNAKFKELMINNGIPGRIDGILQTQNTSILGIIPLNLGDVTSSFVPSSNGFTINLNNYNGDIDLNGTVNIDNGGTYLANLTFSRNANTSDQLIQTVQLIGHKVDENTIMLTHSGKIKI